MLPGLSNHLAAGAVLVALTGCSGLAPEPRTEAITHRVVVICPERIPVGECPAWRPVQRPLDMLSSQADALAGAKIVDGCREWLAKRDAARRACIQAHQSEGEFDP